MTDLPMAPDEAQKFYECWGNGGVTFSDVRKAFRTIANMRPEHEHHLEDPFTNGGTYRTYRKTRYVTDWQVDQ